MNRALPFLLAACLAIACSGPSNGPTGGNQFGLTPQQMSDFVEAFFLGSGPAANAANVGCPPKAWRTWSPAIDAIVVKMSPRFPASEAEKLMAVFNLFGQLRGIALTQAVTDKLNFMTAGEVNIRVVDDINTCGAGKTGCTHTPNGAISYADLYFLPQSAVALHEAEHAIGACHVGASSPAYSRSAMGGVRDGGVPPLDEYVIRTVYEKYLREGATRDDFVAAGLVLQ